MILKNPFSDYGGIVSQNKFVGRKTEIKQIHKRVLGETFGNLAIMGLPRIGKSSLAWNSIIVNKNELIKNNILPIWIPLGELSNLNELFDEVLTNTCEIVNKNEIAVLEELKEIRRNFIEALSNLEKRRYVKKFLRLINDNFYRLIIIIDEFDNAENIFNLQDFQFLREISYNLETKIAIITISRKTVQELEPDNGSLSNFYQIFDELRLKLFSDEDLINYWQRIRDLGIIVSTDYMNNTQNYSGKHPYLLDLINYNIFNEIEQTNINLDEIFNLTLENLKLKLYNEYESILKLMENEHLDSKLVQLIIGPVYDINQRDVEKLLKYSLVEIISETEYSSFADFFTKYLSIKSKEMDVWPLFSQFEIEMRMVVKSFLHEKFGEDWSNQYPQKNMISELILNRDVNKRAFKEKASDDLIDYTYPKHFYDYIISSNWEWFKPILNKDKGYWKQRFDLLTKIRNPLAHNNKSFLSTEENSLATIYCREIIELIKIWKENK
jgi:hypothetical protein